MLKMINFTTNLSSGTPPGWASPIYAECGYNYCMPIETCRHVLDSAIWGYKFVDIGVLICVIILVLFTEYYFRKYMKLKKELENCKCQSTETSNTK